MIVTEGLTAGDVCLSFIYAFAPYCELHGDVLGHEGPKISRVIGVHECLLKLHSSSRVDGRSVR